MDWIADAVPTVVASVVSAVLIAGIPFLLREIRGTRKAVQHEIPGLKASVDNLSDQLLDGKRERDELRASVQVNGGDVGTWIEGHLQDHASWQLTMRETNDQLGRLRREVHELVVEARRLPPWPFRAFLRPRRRHEVW